MARPWHRAVKALLDQASLARPDELPSVVDAVVAPLGIQIRMYTADQEQRALRPVAVSGRTAPRPLPVETTLAGRAFMLMRPVPAVRRPGEAARLWMPLLDADERLGVLEVVATDASAVLTDPGFQAQCRTFARLVGHLLTSRSLHSDVLVGARRTRRMSEASELLWALFPPLTMACERMTISAILEPCYEAGGDGFDYAVDGTTAHVAVLDTAGHELRAGLGTATVLSALRAARRGGDGLYAMARAADAALAVHLPELRFTTGVLASLDLDSGLLRYLNAGHPPPMLLRHGKVVRHLDRGRRMPLGIDDPLIEVAEETLEPDDRLLLFTDGVVDARDGGGEPFGEDRLVDLVQQHAAAELPVPETLRRLCHAVLAHYDGPPRDDATLMLVEWPATVSSRMTP